MSYVIKTKDVVATVKDCKKCNGVITRKSGDASHHIKHCKKCDGTGRVRVYTQVWEVPFNYYMVSPDEARYLLEW